MLSRESSVKRKVSKVFHSLSEEAFQCLLLEDAFNADCWRIDLHINVATDLIEIWNRFLLLGGNDLSLQGCEDISCHVLLTLLNVSMSDLR